MTVYTIKADLIPENDSSSDRTIRIVFDQDTGSGVELREDALNKVMRITPIGTSANLGITLATKGSGALKLPGALTVLGGTVNGLVTPTAASDAVPKSYVDALPGTLVVEDGVSPPVTLTNEDEDDWLYGG